MKKMKISRETAFVLAAFLLSGVSALIYEVVWTRALSLVLGSTVYALSTMLSTFMAGLAIGAYMGGKFSDRGKNLLFLFALCELVIGVFGLASIPLIYSLPSYYLFVYNRFHLYPTLFFAVQIAMCSMVMLVPTIMMGATFPLVSRKITVALDEMGRKVGDAYCLNTIGAVIGSLAAGFFLIPRVGINGTAIVAGLLNLLVGLSMLLLSRRHAGKTLVAALPVFVLVMFWAGTARLETSLLNFYTANRGLGRSDAGADFMLKGMASMQQQQVFYEEHMDGPVRAFKLPDGSLLLQVGGKLEGTIRSDIPNTKLLAYLPIAAHPEPVSFLTIGLGAGVTFGAARERLADVDLVEINPGVVKAVSLHGQPGLLRGARVIVNDARNHLLTAGRKYDIISSEPSYPTESGVANLFTREFYEIAAQKLNKGGIYCQWLPYYALSNSDVTMMIKTFGSVFPHVFLWKIPESMDLILTGSREPFRFGEDGIRQRVKEMFTGGEDLSFVVSRTPDQVRGIIENDSIPVNTDDKPVLEFNVVNNFLLGDLSAKDGQ